VFDDAIGLDELYENVVMDHYRNPRNAQPLAEQTHSSKAYNPLCGDESNFQANLRGDKIAAVAVFGRGCAISQAAGSVMSEMLLNAGAPQALRLIASVRAAMRGDDLSESELDELGDMNAMLGVRRYPIRIKCALLPWTVAETALKGAIV